MERHYSKRGQKSWFTGLLIIAIGIIWLLRKMEFDIPYWVSSWQMLMIVAGIGLGLNNRFRSPVSLGLIGVGTVLLLSDTGVIPLSIRDYFWPVILIGIGLMVLIRPNHPGCRKIGPDEEAIDDAAAENAKQGRNSWEDKLDLVSICNGLKRNVFSRRFRGGETVTVCGGTEINMMRADFEKAVKLDVTVVMGGLKLIVPPTWEVRMDVNAILGGVEDKRYLGPEEEFGNKTLILTGTVLLGGLEIITY